MCIDGMMNDTASIDSSTIRFRRCLFSFLRNRENGRYSMVRHKADFIEYIMRAYHRLEYLVMVYFLAEVTGCLFYLLFISRMSSWSSSSFRFSFFTKKDTNDLNEPPKKVFFISFASSFKYSLLLMEG